MYKVLYRKYRPQFFSGRGGPAPGDGHPEKRVDAGPYRPCLPVHRLPRDGKTTCAKILARAVNCLHPKDGDPCGECEVCKGLENGSILDVVEIDAASNNGVDSIRSLMEESNFTPANGQATGCTSSTRSICFRCRPSTPC